MDTIKFEVNSTVEVTKQQLQDLLVCAFEGGSNYWYEELEPLKETNKGGHTSDNFYNDLYEHGFSLRDKETGNKHVIPPRCFRDALVLMHNKHRSHFNDIAQESTDAETGDVFLQLLIHGDVIYG